MNKFYLLLAMIVLPFVTKAQNEIIEKHNNLVYYNTNIKDYLEFMKENSEDPKVLELIAEMQKQNTALEEYLNTIQLPEAEAAVEAEMPEEPAEDWGTDEGEPGQNWDLGVPETEEEEEIEGFGMSRFIPFRNKIKTTFEIQFGINNLNKKSVAAGLGDPDIYTPASWYWEFGLLTKNRLGGKTSKVALSYGFTYLINRFSIDNDLRVDVLNDQPFFINVEDSKKNPKLNVGYLTIPIAFDFKLSKRFQFSIGGFAGYRVHTIQKLETKTGYERINEERSANYLLNNWIYGAKVSLGVRGFNIIGRYCFSNLFRENNNYDFNTFMIGTAIRI